MSWDVLLYSADGTPGTLAALQEGDGVDLPVMGDAPAVRRALSVALPEVDWSDPGWGRLEGTGFSIEFNVDREGPVTHVMLHVRGEGDPVTLIVALCKANTWRALDTVTGVCLDLENPSRKGWNDFCAYRDKVIDKPEC
jgi:hypothetical protein